MTKEQPKQITPPYLSLTKLEEVLELVGNRTYGELTPTIFRDNKGFSPADAFLAMNALKFFNLITDDGKPTELMSKIGLKGEARKEVFKEIVKSAYGKLFAVVQVPQELPPAELFNEMKMQYSLSPRITRQAVPVFLKIAELAGLIEEGSVVSRKRKQPTTKKQSLEKWDNRTPRKSPKENAFEYDFHIPIVEEKMYIEIPESLHQRSFVEDELNVDLRKLIKEAHTFADKYLKNKTSVDDTETN